MFLEKVFPLKSVGPMHTKSRGRRQEQDKLRLRNGLRRYLASDSSSSKLLCQEKQSATDEELISSAKTEWLHGRKRRLALGLILRELRTRYSKRGHGTYTKILKEHVGIAYSTAIDYVNEANEEYGFVSTDFVDNDLEQEKVVSSIQSANARVAQARQATSKTLTWRFDKLPADLYAELARAKQKLTKEQVIAALLKAVEDLYGVAA